MLNKYGTLCLVQTCLRPWRNSITGLWTNSRVLKFWAFPFWHLIWNPYRELIQGNVLTQIFVVFIGGFLTVLLCWSALKAEEWNFISATATRQNETKTYWLNVIASLHSWLFQRFTWPCKSKVGCGKQSCIDALQQVPNWSFGNQGF